jgi:alpha-tubulin suppressor-like RCC1 family protein
LLKKNFILRNGNIGDGTTTQRKSPTPVDVFGALSGITLKKIELGGFHTCSISTEPILYCWGGGRF